MCNSEHRVRTRLPQTGRWGISVFKLIATMRRGSASGIAAASARYDTVDAARIGIATLFRDDRVLRAMIVRDEIPPEFVEWVER